MNLEPDRPFQAQIGICIRTFFQSALLLIVISTTGFSASSVHENCLIAISFSNELGSPSNEKYMPGDNVWLKLEMKNLSDQPIHIPKGDTYTRPRLMKDGAELPYKKDVGELIRDHESNSSHAVKDFWTLKPDRQQYDLIDLSYWYDLQPGYYQVTVDKRLSEKQAANSNTLFFEVLPQTSDLRSESPIVVRAGQPAYPAMAVSRRVSGTVRVDVEIDSNGKVTSAKVISGPVMLRRAASDAALLWRFNSVDSSTEPRSVQLTFVFREISYEPKEGEQDYAPPYQMAIRQLAMPVVAQDLNERKTSKSFIKRTMMLPRRIGEKIF